MTKQQYIQDLYEHLKNIYVGRYSIAVGWSQDNGHYVRVCPLNMFDHIIFINIVNTDFSPFENYIQITEVYKQSVIYHLITEELDT